MKGIIWQRRKEPQNGTEAGKGREKISIEAAAIHHRRQGKVVRNENRVRLREPIRYCGYPQKVVYLIEDHPAVLQDTAGGFVPSAHGAT